MENENHATDYVVVMAQFETDLIKLLRANKEGPAALSKAMKDIFSVYEERELTRWFMIWLAAQHVTLYSELYSGRETEFEAALAERELQSMIAMDNPSSVTWIDE